MTLRELIQQPNKCIVVYFDTYRQFQLSDLEQYMYVSYYRGECAPVENNGTIVHICTGSMRGEQFAGMRPDYIVVKGWSWDLWEGKEQLLWRLTVTGGEIVYDK